jgi:Flp pilus assembly protein CpaB
MRIVACGLIAAAALLGLVPAAMADVPASTANADSQAVPQTEVSMLAVSLTVGGAVATAGSGVALVLTRRRALSRPPSQVSG